MKRTTRPRYHVAIAALTAVTACHPVSSFTRARTLPPCTWELMVAASAAQSYLFPPEDGQGGDVVPSLEVAVRRGVTPRFEAGLRVFALGAVAEGKLQLATDLRDGAVDIALTTAVGYQLYTPDLGSNAAFHLLPVVVALATGIAIGRFELLVAPKLANEVWLGFGAGSVGSHADLVYAGGTLGLSRRLGRATWMVEVTVLEKLWTASNVGPGLGGERLLQLGVGAAL